METVDIFAPEYADTAFQLANVILFARRLGKLFGIDGPRRCRWS